MVEQNQALSDSQKKYLTNYSDQYGEFLRQGFSSQADMYKGNLLKKRIQVLKSQAEDAVSKGAGATAKGQSEVAQMAFEKALKYYEQIQQLQFGAVGSGSPMKDNQLLKAANQAQQAMDAVFAKMEAASQKAQQAQQGQLAALNGELTKAAALKTQLENTDAIKAMDLEAAAALRTELERMLEIKLRIGQAQAIGESPLGVAGPAPGSKIPGRASGGPVTGGGLYWVGENGPELFAPGVNGSILDAYNSSQLMRGTDLPMLPSTTQGAGNGTGDTFNFGTITIPGAPGVNMSQIHKQAAFSAKMSRIRKG